MQQHFDVSLIRQPFTLRKFLGSLEVSDR